MKHDFDINIKKNQEVSNESVLEFLKIKLTEAFKQGRKAGNFYQGPGLNGGLKELN